MDRKVVTTNRKAYHDYTIFEKFVAGIVLTGTEIKSIRKNAINKNLKGIPIISHVFKASL